MNSIIKLKNIKKNNNIIECDILPEDSKEFGHVSIEIDSKNLKEYKLPAGYEWCRKHVSHVQNTLLDFAKSDNIPKEKLIMWI